MSLQKIILSSLQQHISSKYKYIMHDDDDDDYDYDTSTDVERTASDTGI